MESRTWSSDWRINSWLVDNAYVKQTAPAIRSRPTKTRSPALRAVLDPAQHGSPVEPYVSGFLSGILRGNWGHLLRRAKSSYFSLTMNRRKSWSK